MKYIHKKIKNGKDGVSFEVKLDFSELEPFRQEAYKKLSSKVKVPGFRPGKAPKSKVEPLIATDVLDEALGKLLSQIAYEIIIEQKARPLDTPKYEVKKLSAKEGIEFIFTYVNYPTIKHGDYSKIKVTKQSPEVKDTEVEEVIKSIINSSIKPEKIKELAKTKEIVEKHTTGSGKDAKEHEHIKLDFELNDKLVKELGYEKEKTLKDVKEMVKTRLLNIKSEQLLNEYNAKVLDEALKLAKFEIPSILIEGEVKRQEDIFSTRLKELKLDTNTYLTTQKTSIEQKRKEWEEESVKQISIDLLLISLAEEKGEVATDEDVQKEIDSISDPQTKSQYNSSRAREYVRTVITRQKGMKRLLEKIK